MKIGAPSSAPRLLHCACEPLRHKMVARRIAKESLVLIHLITSLQLFTHLSARQSAIFLKKFLASLPIVPSTEPQIGVKLALFSKLAFTYFSYFSLSAEISMSLGEQLPYDWVSVSGTCISNNATAWACQTPQTVRSATNASEWLSSSASLMTGSLFTWLQAIAARSPMAFLTSLCFCNTKFSFLQINKCSKLKGTPPPSQLAGIYCKGLLYLIARPSQNSCAVKS